MNKILNNNKLQYFVFLLILIGAFSVRLYKIQSPIADWHSWRQSDTASVSLNYLNNGIDLLHPRYNDISAIQTGYFNAFGYRFVEFPIFNLYHTLGYTVFSQISFDMWGRLISVIAATVSTLIIFLLGRKLLGKWGGVFASFFYAFIPFNIYFTRVILPDPLSSTFALIGLWLFVLFLERQKKSQLLLSSIYFSLAILVKPQAVFYGVPILFFALRKYGFVNIIKNKSMLIALNIVVIPVLLWRAWMSPFVVGIPHFAWLFNGNGIRFHPSFWRWIFAERLGILILGIWGLIPFSLGILKIGQEKRNKYFIILFLIGMFLYVSIFATANVQHDYYQIFIIPAVCLALAQGSLFLFKQNIFNKFFAIIFLGFSVGMMFLIGITEIRGFYNINHYEIIEAGKAADKLLPKDALIIAPYNGDTAFLYQTRRNGWPVVDESIGEMINKGADYYISVNTGDADTTNFKEIFETIDESDAYVIFDLHKYKL